MIPIIIAKAIAARMNTVVIAPIAPAELPNKNGINGNRYFVIVLLHII